MGNTGLTNSDPYNIKGVYEGNELSLTKIDLKDVRIVNGNEFPLAFKFGFKKSIPSLKTIAAFLKDVSSEGIFQDLLIKHGAVLIRGLDNSTAEAYSKFVTSIETARDKSPFQQIGLAGKRHEKAENVFTANEGPHFVRFYQHNEYARFNHYPSNIHFFCQEAPPPSKGGGTPIANSLELFDRIYAELPEFVDELTRKGLITSQVYPGKSRFSSFALGNEFFWEDKDTFGHEILPNDSFEVQKEKAEIQIRKLTDDFDWNNDGSLTVRQHVPAIRIHPEIGKPIFFNGLIGRYGTSKDKKALEPPYKGTDGGYYLPTRYDNGDLIDVKYLSRLLEISLEIEFHHSWQESDLLLVDNYQVSHGRLPWESGARVILVSMWDDKKPKPEIWKSST